MSTLKVDTMATHYKRRHLKVIRKWCKYCLRREPMLTLKVGAMATHYKRRHLEVMGKWCIYCLRRELNGPKFENTR